MDVFAGEHSQDSQHGKATVADLDVQQADLRRRLVIKSHTEVTSTEVAPRGSM